MARKKKKNEEVVEEQAAVNEETTGAAEAAEQEDEEQEQEQDRYVIETSDDEPPLFTIMDTETDQPLVDEPFQSYEEAEAYLQVMQDGGLNDTTPAPVAAEAAADAADPAEKANDTPEPPAKGHNADFVADEVPRIWVYQRRAGFAPADVKQDDGSMLTVHPGQTFTTERPNVIPPAFMDGWEVVQQPEPGPDSKPRLVPTAGGFDLISVAGRKLNDLPIRAAEAEELLGGIAS